MLQKCRACLGINDDLKSITEDDPEGAELISMFTCVTNFEWIRDDHTSSYLCRECENTLKITYKFRRKCLESHDCISRGLGHSGGINTCFLANFEEIVEDAKSSDFNTEQENDHQCVYCFIVLPSHESLVLHISRSHKVEEENCNKSLDNELEHRKIHAAIQDETLAIGKKCAEEKKNENPITYENNLESKSDSEYENTENLTQKNNFCTKCDKKVRSLSVHMKEVHSINEEESPRKYTCHVCSKELKTRASLYNHVKLIHMGETAFKCKFCGKPIKDRVKLIEHERVHTGEKPHLCNVCGKGFAQVGALNTHLRIHTGRTEVCKICHKGFCRPSQLKVHLRKHSGEKPFLCTECGKAYLQKSHLNEHMNSHSNFRPFHCMYCDKAFKGKSLLNTHLRIHIGYKPFRCKLCEYACFKAYRLQQHMKSHENVAKSKDHVCPACSKSFATQTQLNGHVTSSHGVILGV